MERQCLNKRVLPLAEEGKAFPGLSIINERAKSTLSKMNTNCRLGGLTMNWNAVKPLLLWTTCTLVMLTALVGCKSSPLTGIETTGFLSDYSRLEPISGTSQRYINPKCRLGSYSGFIVDRVEMLMAPGEKSAPKNWDDVEKLRDYMRTVIELSIRRPYEVVTQPGIGVARIRIAITGLKGASAAGLGSSKVSMQAEILDSQTGEQIAAIVESQKKGGMVSEYSGKWRDAQEIMDAWAKRFYSRLEEARRR